MLFSTVTLGLLLAAAPTVGEVDTALRRPLSPGAVVLMLGLADDEHVRARLVEALSHDDPRVRAAAARVAGVVSLKAGLPPLRVAFGRERDVATGLEQASALALLEDAADPAVLRAAAALGPAGLEAWASTRALSHPALLVSELPAVRAAGLDDQMLTVVLHLGASRDKAVIERALTSAAETDDTTLGRAALEAAGSLGLPEDATPLARALTAPSLHTRRGRASGASLLVPVRRSGRRMRLAGSLPPGYAEDALAVAGCKLDGSVAGGLVGYRDDGRAQSVRLYSDLGISSACREAVWALLASLHEGPGRAAPEGEAVLLPLDKAALSCPPGAAVPSPGKARGARGVGGAIQEPRKVRHVNVRYPESARARRVQGVVLLEGTIDPGGCLTSLEVLETADPALDVEALRAVAGWRYSPTLLDGEPVPVTMTFTVNFKLN